MAADATAASVYQGLVKNVDPIGAYAAGVQVRAKLEAINAAVPAEIFANTMNLMKLADARSAQQQKMKLAEKELEIATYNAETNRINANRPRTGTSTQTGAGGGFNILSALRTDADGVYLDPSALTGQGAQMPTAGEGDSGEVVPLTPTAGDGTPRVLGDASAGMLPLPQAGQDPGVTPLLPSPQGAAPRASAPAGGGGKLRLGGVTINSKGQPSLSFKAPDSADAPNVLAAPQFLDSLNKQYAHLGVKAVPKADKNGFDFVQAESLSGVDFSISSLPAETQKGFLEDVTTMIQDAAEIENPSDVEKMRAAGVVLPDKPTPDQIAAAGKQMQSEGRDWNAAYVAVKKDKENDLLSKASTYAKKLNAQFAGKVGKGGGYVPRSGIDVLREIGITELQPQQQGNPASGGQGGAMAAAGQVGTVQPTNRNASGDIGRASLDAKRAAAGQAPVTRPAATAGAQASGAPPQQAAPSMDQDPQIRNLRAEISKETDPAKKAQKQQFLTQLEKTYASKFGSPSQPVQQAGTSSSAPPPQTGGGKTGLRGLPSKSEGAASVQQSRAKVGGDADKQQWQNGKQAIWNALGEGGDRDVIEDLMVADEGDPEMGGGKSRESKWLAWFDKNKEKLKITPREKGKLTFESVVFNQSDGRAVTVRDLISAALKDPDFKEDLNAPAQQQKAADTKRTASPAGQSAYQKVFGSK